MVWIIRYGTADALVYSIVRSWIAGCYFGFSFVSLALAVSGGVFATAVMGMLWSVAGKRGIMGCVGIGVAGALFHNIGQLLAVYALMTSNSRIFFQFPVMILASVLFGGCVGALVLPVMRMIERRVDAQNGTPIGSVMLPYTAAPFEIAVTVALFAFSFSLVFITNTIALAIIAGITAIAVIIACKGSITIMFRPFLRFWALFLFIALMYLVLPYGTRLERFSFLTHESVTATLQQWLRLYTWLAISTILMKYRFHVVLFAMMKRLFRHQEITLSAGLLAFEYFPLVMEIGKKQGKGFFKNLVVHPVRSVKQGIGGLYEEILGKIGEGERSRANR
jgi:heptaprenyl diphosphate synthase